MVGIVVATHGHLAQEFVSTAEQIVGKLEAVSTCAIEPTNSGAEIQRRWDRVPASSNFGPGGGLITSCPRGCAGDHPVVVTPSPCPRESPWRPLSMTLS